MRWKNFHQSTPWHFLNFTSILNYFGQYNAAIRAASVPDEIDKIWIRFLQHLSSLSLFKLTFYVSSNFVSSEQLSYFYVVDLNLFPLYHMPNAFAQMFLDNKHIVWH